MPEDSMPENEPVGTGIVAADDVGDNEFDPFFDDEGEQADASVSTLSGDAPASVNPTARANPSGVMGAIFRAISRATIPNLNPTQMLPGAQEGPSQGVEYDPNDDPFGDVGDSTDGAFDFDQ